MELTQIKKSQDNLLITTLFGVSCMLAVIAFILASPSELYEGLIKLLTSPQSLTTDSIAVAGIGGAILNASLCGLMAVSVIKLGRAKITGTSLTAYCVAVAFAFLGVNILNFAVLILGSIIASRINGKKFSEYANFAVFSGSLSPIVSEMMFGKYLNLPLWAGIPAGLLSGIIIGILFPIVCAHTASLHKGYDLYNTGVAGGFIAMVFFGLYKNVILKAAKVPEEFAMNSIFAGRFFKELIVFSIPAVLIFIIGVYINRGFEGYGKMLRESGYQTDYVAKYGYGLVFINFAIVYAIMVAYFGISGFEWTAAAIASIIGAAAWTGAGTHPLNLLPILIGYSLFSLVTGTPLNNTTLTVGIGYATGLTPVSGKFGVLWGIVCGFVHAAVVFNTAPIHGGFCLYNGGFTAGLICIVMVPLMEHFKQKKENGNS